MASRVRAGLVLAALTLRFAGEAYAAPADEAVAVVPVSSWAYADSGGGSLDDACGDDLCGDDLCGEPAAAAWSPADTLELFAGLEGSKQPQDFGVNANFGGRVHGNWGVPVVEDWGLGLQIGTSLNFTDNAVQVFDRVGVDGDRFQNFSTLGLFQRLDTGLSWGAAYDLLLQDSYDEFALGQVRGVVEEQVAENDAVGVWAAAGVHDDDGTWDSALGAVPVTLSAINQANLFWRHAWENRAETTFWAGVAEGHGQVNAALGDMSTTGEKFVFGSDLHVPLSDHVALFGAANFVGPPDTGTVDAYLGFAFYPGGKAHGFRRQKFAPLQAVANSPWFAVDMERR